MGDGLLTDYVDVGYNQESGLAQKGNPKHIPGDIMLITYEPYATIIGTPESCSIGKRSKKILQRNLLSFARDPNLYKTFMLYVVSREDQEVFHKFDVLDAIATPGVRSWNL